MRKSTRGFTLVELAVVIGVIAILATIILIAYNGVQSRSRDARRQTDIANIVKGLELYYDDNGSYPLATGTSSPYNTYWFISSDSSWSTFQSLLSPSAMASVPVDPINNSHPFSASANYSYAYFSGNFGTYCGAQAGQWYLLVYKLEGSSIDQKTEGDCSTNPLGLNFTMSYGDSYYRKVR